MKLSLSIFIRPGSTPKKQDQMHVYRRPLWSRLLAVFLSIAQIVLIMPTPVCAGDGISTLLQTASSMVATVSPGISVNRTTPKPFKPNLVIQFSSKPTADEISQTTLFQEQLSPLGSIPTATENASLANAIKAYSKEVKREDVTPLTNFVVQFPQSAWNLSLDVNLGIIYRHYGYYSRALDAWENAWTLAKNSADPNAQVLGGRAAGELAALLSSLGRSQELQALLADVGARPLYGSSLQQIEAAKEALWMMGNKPGESFKCGPYALGRILAFKKPGDKISPLIINAASSTKGFSLAQTEALSDKLDMNLQMAKRSVGAEILFPAVLHWKVGHYAAILKEDHGQYLVQDPTFGREVYVSPAALDAEASGYFLVPKGKLPTGWQSVSEAEAATVWGQGLVPQRNPDSTTPEEKKCKTCPKTAGMARYNVFAMELSLNLQDTPVGYIPPVGPSVPFVLTFNQLEANQPASPTYSNLGPLWVHNWMAYVVAPSSTGQTVYINRRGGGRETYVSTNYVSTSLYPGYVGYYSADVKTEAVLWVTTTGNYERRLPDGGKEVYSTPNGAGYVFLNQVVDPQGNAVTLTYDGTYRLTAITDAIGQVTTLSYTLAGDSLKITKVTDPFGRTAIFTYSVSTPHTLVSITDEIGLVSQMTYASGNMMTALTTPYGKTTFKQVFTADAGQAVRSIEATDPLGGKEFFESRIDGVGVPANEVNVPSGYGLSIKNDFLNYRNTYYWDKKAVLDYGETDFTKAQIFHFLHTPDGASESPVLESIKMPLESRVWYNYPSQPNPYTQGPTSQPTIVARVIGDGLTTQAYKYAYNAIGNIYQVIDPIGRTFTADYDTNNIDVLDVRQTQGSNNDALLKMTYNTIHRPLTYVDASGQTTQFQYNAQGQITQIKNSKNEITTYTYTGPNGTGTGNFLTKISGPAPTGVTGDSVTCTYDSYDRVNSITDSQGYLLKFSYDNLDRPVTITYPDGTFEDFSYFNLDLTWHSDRLKRWTHDSYDAQQQLTSSTDPLGRTVVYSWCKCGALNSLQDAAGKTTSWTRDVEGRVVAKTFPDQSSYQYVYDLSSRFQSLVDPKGQLTTYTYNIDDTVKNISYSRTSHPTSPISFTYDPNYLKLLTMTDGTGTTNYTYNLYSVFSGSWPTSSTTGVGRLTTETGPLGATAAIAYTYDELGRLTNRTINGAANSYGITYDNLDRVGSTTSILGTFTSSYISTTNRVSSLTYPNGLTASLLYFPNTGDQRLQEIKYTNSASAIISKQDYTYNASGNISTWQRQIDASTPTLYTFNYDGADQLSEAILTQSGSLLHHYVENYDKSANRTSEQIDLNVTSSSYNSLNQLTSQTGGGPLRLSGTVNQPSSVTINGNAASTSTTSNSSSFTAQVNASAGTNVFTVVAKDQSGYATTNRYQVVTPASSLSRSLVYDPDGNLINDGTKTYEWDAKDQLTAINNGVLRSEFTYDGFNRCTSIVEKSSGSITSTKQFVWIGNTMAEERDATGSTVTKRFYAEGEQIGSNSYYYTRDHLGSIRELTNSSGAIVTRYDYDPYGRVTKISGSLDSDFQYTGMYEHIPSGLNLTHFRAYDPNIGRWLSRDPIAERGGINIYGYVGNDPIDKVDPDGRWGIFFVVLALFAVGLGISIYELHENLAPIGEANGALARFQQTGSVEDLKKYDELTKEAQQGVYNAAQSCATTQMKTLTPLEEPMNTFKDIVFDITNHIFNYFDPATASPTPDLPQPKADPNMKLRPPSS